MIKKEVYPTVWLVFSCLSLFALEQVPYALDILLGYVYLVFPVLITLYSMTILGVRIPPFVSIMKERGSLYYYELPFTMMVCGVFYHLHEGLAVILTLLVTVFGTVAHEDVFDE